MLTGRCKEEFEKWHEESNSYVEYYEENEDNTGIPTYEGRYMHFQIFTDFPLSMQIGVYEDFFDSVGIHISIANKPKDKGVFFGGYIDEEDGRSPLGSQFKSRPGARTAAIEKANEIYNNTKQ